MAILRYCFDLACFATAFGMTVFWLYKFGQDEDLVQVKLKPFETLSYEQRPMLSFCFWNPFIESELKRYNMTLNGQLYREAISGEREYIGIEKIDFGDVTLNLTDFYLDDFIIFRNGTYLYGASPNFLNALPTVTYSGYYNKEFRKCYGLSFEYTNASYVAFGFNSSVFPNSIREKNAKFSTHFHLPNKFMMDENVEKLSWHKRTNRKAYTMNFKLRQLEIVRKRNKRSDPCISDDLNYDEIILTEHLEKVGCKAPYQKTTKDLAICNSKDTLYGAKYDAREFQNSRAACTSASTITFTYEEVDLHFDDKFFS